MPHALARCQPIPATRRQINEVTASAEASAHGFTLVREEAEQWVSHTRSRRVPRRRDWLKAVRWMVAQGFRDGTNETTLRIAEDIAARMYRSKDGTVAYCLAGMMARLRLSRRCVAKHVQFLRELGLLAWAEKGSSLRNAVRARKGTAFGPHDGFKRSATIYAPVAPPAWDEHQGLRIDGLGYWARVQGVTHTGRQIGIEDAQDDARAAEEQQGTNHPGEPVDNSGSCTPSVRTPKPRTTARDSGGKKDRARTRAPRCGKTPGLREKGSTGWTPAMTAAAMNSARLVQLHTWWTQGSCVRELGYALRPLFAAGWSWEMCARQLAGWSVPLRPRHVGSYVASEIRRRVNAGLLFLPDGSVRPYRQAPADDGRYQNWLRRRRDQAARRWEETAGLREQVRRLMPAGRKAKRVPRGLVDARPERVLLSSAEIKEILTKTPSFRSCEDLWAEAEARAAARLEGCTW